jgi:hypothetical protein
MADNWGVEVEPFGGETDTQKPCSGGTIIELTTLWVNLQVG